MARVLVGYGTKMGGTAGIAESIDWTRALISLDRHVLDPETVNATLGALLKYEDDLGEVRGKMAGEILADVETELAAS